MAIIAVVVDDKEIKLPSPSSIRIGDEIIWSSNTGRTTSGLMVGDVIAEKEQISIVWQYLTKAEKDVIKNNLKAGFFPVIINVDGEPYRIDTYRGTLTSEPIGQLDDGIYYYKEVECNIIER